MERKSAPVPEKRVSLEERRKSLLELAEQGRLFAEREVLHLHPGKDDETLIREIDERDRIFEILRTRSPEIKEGLKNPALFDAALDAAYEIVCTLKFGPRVSKYVADAMPELQKQFEDASPHTGKILQVAREAYTMLKPDDDASSKVSKDAIKIRETILRSKEALGLYFSEANIPKPHERFDRIAELTDVIRILGAEHTDWAFDMVVDIMAGAIKSRDYHPELSSERLLQLIGSRKKGEPTSSLPYGSITRADIEAVCNAFFDKSESIEIIRSIFTRFGLPRTMYDELSTLPEWQEGTPLHFNEIFQKAIEQFESFQRLEIERPGSVRALYTHFGIRWFSRYPADVLIEQFDEINSNDRPYGVFASGVVDWNLSFFTENDTETVGQLSGDLSEKGYALRIIECNSKNEFAGILTELDRIYGGEHKIDFLILRAHSGRDRMELGTGGTSSDLDVEDFENKDFVKRLNVFSENPTIIVDGCSVGRKGGIAEKMSKVFGATVYAPKGIQSSLTDIAVKGENGRLSFTPEYAVHSGKEKGVHLYINGKKR